MDTKQLNCPRFGLANKRTSRNRIGQRSRPVNGSVFNGVNECSLRENGEEINVLKVSPTLYGQVHVSTCLVTSSQIHIESLKAEVGDFFLYFARWHSPNLCTTVSMWGIRDVHPLKAE